MRARLTMLMIVAFAAQAPGAAKEGATTMPDTAVLGGGCFWCIEAVFQRLDGVHSVTSGYAGGETDNPDYRSVCGGRTGHAEVVQVVYDPAVIDFETLLEVFFTAHDPTQKNRQGNDVGTQYRSGIYAFDEAQLATARQSLDHYQQALQQAGRQDSISTEIVLAPTFYYAEDYHQQYLAKNPGGYCGHGGCGVQYSGLEVSA